MDHPEDGAGFDLTGASADRLKETELLNGNIDEATRHCLSGWAQEPANPHVPVELEISVDGDVVTRLLANRYRQDLHRASIGFGMHGFSLNFMSLSPLRDHVITVQRTRDGTHLHGSPVFIARLDSFSEKDKATLGEYLVGQAEGEGLDHMTSFLAEQVNRLLQKRWERCRPPERDGSPHFQRRWKSLGELSVLSKSALVVRPSSSDPMGSLLKSLNSDYVRSLIRLGYDVGLAMSNLAAAESDASLPREVRLYSSPWIASIEELLRRGEDKYEVVLIEGSSNLAYIPFVRYFQPRAVILFQPSEAHSRTYGSGAGNAPSDRFMLERRGSQRADVTLEATEEDISRSASIAPGVNARCIHWSQRLAPQKHDFSARSGILLLGGLCSPSDVSTAQSLLDLLMVEVLKIDPAIKILLPTRSVPQVLRSFVNSETAGNDPIEVMLSKVRLSIVVAGDPLMSARLCALSIAHGAPPVDGDAMMLSIKLSKDAGGRDIEVEKSVRTIVGLHSRQSDHHQSLKAGRTLVEQSFSEAGLDERVLAAIRSRSNEPRFQPRLSGRDYPSMRNPSPGRETE